MPTMAKKRGERKRTGEPYVRVHKGYWHLYYRNPDPTKPYPAHKSLGLAEDERLKALTASARNPQFATARARKRALDT